MNNRQSLEQNRQRSLEVWAQAQRQALHEAVKNTPANPAVAAAASGTGSGGVITPITPAVDTGQVYLLSNNFDYTLNVFIYNTKLPEVVRNPQNLGGIPFAGISSVAADPVNGGLLIVGALPVPESWDYGLFRLVKGEGDKYNLESVCEIQSNALGFSEGIAVDSATGDVTISRADKGTGQYFLSRISQATGQVTDICEFTGNTSPYVLHRVCSSEKPGFVNLIYLGELIIINSPTAHTIVEVELPSSPGVSLIINPAVSDFIISQYVISNADIAADGTLYAFNTFADDMLNQRPAILSQNKTGQTQLDYGLLFGGVEEMYYVATLR